MQINIEVPQEKTNQNQVELVAGVNWGQLQELCQSSRILGGGERVGQF